MSKPVIADNKPIKVELTKGQEYYFCTCGLSKNQPFCDGSHASTDFKPKSFVAEQDGDNYLCRCKHSNNLPFCDGSHKQFSDDQVGQEGPGVQIQNVEVMPVATPTKEEPTVEFIHQLAREGLSKMGHHGPMTSMGVPRHLLPHWDDIQVMVAQMATKPLMEDVPVATELVIGPQARKPLKLKILCLSQT
ncbi:glutamate synthase [Vibrio sp. JCM 19236]|nr:glutamate synthase [Vibrio sp. JCM 19236]